MKRWRERARRHPETPWYARLAVAGFVAYAVTPVDLFPDALPVLGIAAPATLAMQRSTSWIFLLALLTALAAAGIAFYI